MKAQTQKVESVNYESLKSPAKHTLKKYNNQASQTDQANS